MLFIPSNYYAEVKRVITAPEIHATMLTEDLKYVRNRIGLCHMPIVREAQIVAIEKKTSKVLSGHFHLTPFA